MKKLLLLFAMVTPSMFYAALLHAEPVYYVQSANAKIWLGSSFKSKVIAEVGKGQMLTSTGQEGSWIKVKIDGKEGYVPSLLLSTHPPLEKTVVIKAEDSEIKQGVRRRASSYSSAAAARGLTREDRERADIEEGVDFNALKKMESLSLTADEVTQFMEGGKL
jgi:uncharacterized protein YgiM (DUF1202 family)